jgi:type I restriction enzyme M protein
MIEMVDLKSIVPGLVDPENTYKVVDPACGSGGFLVTGMHILLDHARQLHRSRLLDDKAYRRVAERIKKEVFYGSDAKHMLARTAKMNMIIAGDGFMNIHHGNSLTQEIPFLRMGEAREQPLADVVLANPPFGMSESDLDSASMELYEQYTTRGQALFLQKMIRITRPDGLICTVIDEGILNTQSMADARRYILKKCFLEAAIHLPYVTFEPNYARVSTSVLLMRRKSSDTDKQDYPVFMYDLKEIGYSGNGKPAGTPPAEIAKQVVEAFRKFRLDHEAPIPAGAA